MSQTKGQNSEDRYSSGWLMVWTLFLFLLLIFAVCCFTAAAVYSHEMTKFGDKIAVVSFFLAMVSCVFACATAIVSMASSKRTERALMKELKEIKDLLASKE